MSELYDTDAWSLFPLPTPPAAEKAPTEAAQPELTWVGFWTWFRNLPLFDPGAIIMILAWIFFWWIIFI